MDYCACVWAAYSVYILRECHGFNLKWPHRLTLGTHVLQLVDDGTWFRGGDDISEERPTWDHNVRSWKGVSISCSWFIYCSLRTGVLWMTSSTFSHRYSMPSSPWWMDNPLKWQVKINLLVWCCFRQVPGQSDTKVTNTSRRDWFLLHLTFFFVNSEQTPCLDNMGKGVIVSFAIVLKW